MTSGTHTINRSHQPCVDVTSAPSHRSGLEPGFPVRDAGAQRLQPLASIG